MKIDETWVTSNSNTDLWTADEGFNTDGLNPTKYRMIIDKLPHFNFFLQEVNVPAISINEVQLPYREINWTEIGEKVNYGDLVCKIMLDADLNNFREITGWMKSICVNRTIQTGRDDSNMDLVLNDKTYLRFYNAWPKSITDIQLSSTVKTIQYATAIVTFNLNHWEFV